LDVYRDWLLSLTICDPACGSGAFLNQALDFLIAEHQYVNELESKLLGQSIVFKDIGDHILERNIYGVDINEESVEIARLSLWLRTATKGRKLNDLSGNIKCGNSLIDDPAVAGTRPFRLEEGVSKRCSRRVGSMWWWGIRRMSLESIHSCKRKDIFETKEKLFFRRVSERLIFTYDNEQYFALNTLIVVNLKEGIAVSIKALLAVLNSTLMNYYYAAKYKSTKKVFSEIQTRTVKLLPICNGIVEQDEELARLAEAQMKNSKLLDDCQELLTTLLQSKYTLPKLSRNLENWPALDFKGFLKELKKALASAKATNGAKKVTLTLAEEAEWLGYFTEQQAKAHALQAEIDKTDAAIDALVYQLYGLTEEEVKVVEGKA
jgi:hypothetical protein